MGRQLREIARRRAELVNRAHDQRLALSDNRLWESGPFLIVENVLDFGHGIGAGNSVLKFAAAIIAVSFPYKTIRLAGRSLMIWMTFNRIRKKLLQ